MQRIKQLWAHISGPSELEVASSYEYLGVWLDDHLDYQNCVNALGESARKALGLLTAKSKQFGNFPIEVFSSFYDSLIIPGWCLGLQNFPQITNRSEQGNWVWVKTAQ